MKLNIAIEIDYIDEEYNLDDTIKNEIINKVSSMFMKGVKDSVKRKINSRVSILADEWIMDQLHSFCDRQIKITDKWGDPQEHHESVTEMFKAKFDEFFNATVDDSGKTLKSCSYGSKRTTRIDHMLNQKADEYLKKITDGMDRNIAIAIDNATAQKIAEKIKKHALEQLEKIELSHRKG
jgi:predicted RNA-binding protein Jag